MRGCPGKAEFLLHPAGEFACQAVRKGPQAREIQEVIEVLLRLLGRKAAKVAIELEVFPNGEILIKAKPLGHIADEIR